MAGMPDINTLWISAKLPIELTAEEAQQVAERIRANEKARLHRGFQNSLEGPRVRVSGNRREGGLGGCR